MHLMELLQEKVAAALQGLVEDPAPYATMIRPADARFGDYQLNCAMPLARVLGKKPTDIAAQIVERLKLDDMLETPEIAGPGFINLRLRSDWLANAIQRLTDDARCGVVQVAS